MGTAVEILVGGGIANLVCGLTGVPLTMTELETCPESPDQRPAFPTA